MVGGVGGGAGMCVGYGGNFDIIWDRFERSNQVHTTSQTPRDFDPRRAHAPRILIAACNPMACARATVSTASCDRSTRSWSSRSGVR